MECSGCGFENRDGTRFCVECGNALALRCPACSADHAAGQKFCGECGTALTGTPAATPSAVRKTVTVLFADLSGSTGFGERNDAEIARQVLARYHALLQETVDAHAGTVAKFMGDGMMATWGIPEVSEDDARRAVAAGVDLQQRFEAFAADVERRHGELLALRVGINTGEVVIGEGDADLIGDALNVAARLEHAARPGHVLVGEETWRLTRGDVAYESLGEVTVAGRAQPVAVYEVADQVESEPEVAAPFVGRDAEMERLVAAFDDARVSGAARLVTVLGSPGVGKTRLSRELCGRLAADAEAQSVELRCDRAGEATFAPVAQLIRDASGITDDLDADAARAAIGTLLPAADADHSRVVDVLAGLVGVGPARSVEETFWGVRRLVEATAATRPLVVVIDDIQWAEPLLLDLIEHLAEWVADAAVLVVGLARPELREVRPSLSEPGRPVAAVVVLDGLDASATEALAAGLLGTDHLPAGLVERLPESTDGNPLFVRELVRMLVDDRVIRRRDDGVWELTIDAEAVDVPPTIQSLLGARVERLPAAEREVLEFASVVGAEFSLGALRELAGERAPVGSLLESMRRKELVEPTGTYWGDEPVHRFHHVLIRDAAYRRLLKTTRAELHERVAVWTDRTAADLVGEHETATAFHYEQAFRYRTELGTVDDDTVRLGRRAAELLTTAAQRALGRDDLASAGASSARALTLLPESDASARADLLQMGCECLLASGDGAAAKPLVEELGRSSTGDPRLAAWAECFAAQLVGLTDPEGLVAADAQAQAAAEALTGLGDGSGQAKAHQVRAGLLARLGRVGDAELELDLALAAARAADDRRRVTAVLGAAPDAALFGPSPVARAGGRCLDVVRLLRITTASPAVEAASNRCQAVLESLRGRFDVSRSMLASARAALEELGLRHGLAQTELYAGMVELIAGNPHGAVAPLRAAYEGLGTLGVGADAGQAAALLATALLAEGEVDEAELMAAESEALAGQNLKTAIGWRVARAEVLAARGDLAGSVALAEEAVGIAAGTDLVIDHADACVTLATLRAQAGDAAGARAARADAKRLYEQKGATVPAERLDAAPDRPEPVPVAATAVATGGARPSAPSNAATEVLVRAAGLYAAGRFDECGALFAEDVLTFDRRRVIGADIVGRAALVANFEATAELGMGAVQFEPIAVRGSTLALCRVVMDLGDWVSSFLMLSEFGPDGLGTLGAWFDEDAVADAVGLLDEWYLAGEGAEHADLLRPAFAYFAAFHARDWDALAEAVRGSEVVDHRGLWPGGGPEAHVERMRSLVATAPDATIVVRELQVRGDAVLMTNDVRATTAEGGRHDNTHHAVGHLGGFEYFDEENFAAALARLDELGGRTAPASVGPAVENAASRVEARATELLGAGSDRELGELIASEFVYEDRRNVVNFGVSDFSASAAHLDWARRDGQEFATPQVLAVRGDRLALSRRTQFNPSGYDRSSLGVVEINERGQWLALVQFDEVDLDAALEELDARYVAGEGAEHAEIVATNAAFFRALNQFDLDVMRELADPDFVYIDHRQLGTPPLDIAGFIEWQEGYRDVENHAVVADIQVRGRVDLVTAVNHAVDANGGEIHWPFLVVGVVGVDGRVIRTEVFAPEDRDAALARFEELSGDRGRPTIGNTATRAFDEIVTLATSRRFEEFGVVVALDFERNDRRTGVSADPVRGPEAWATAFRATVEAGLDRLVVEPLAVRGDRLALDHLMFTSTAGDETPMLAVIEVDEAGRLSYAAWYDEEARDAAVAELDERYVVGEGAAHADLVRVSAAWMRALDDVDLDALREIAAPDFVLVDRRALSWPTVDLDGFMDIQRAYGDIESRFLARRFDARGRVVLTHLLNEAVDADGGAITWEFGLITVVTAEGRVARAEIFADEDRDAALARFDELSNADPRTPDVENVATTVHARVIAALAADDEALLGDLVAPDFVHDDRRTVVNMGRTDRRGAASYLPELRTQGFEWKPPTPVAVRGERLAVIRSEFRTGAGDDNSSLVIVESDDQGRLLSVTQLDHDAVPAAIAELDQRYLAGEGAEHADLLRLFNANAAGVAAQDYAGLADLTSPEFEYVDHRLVSWGTRNRQGFAAMRRGYGDLPTTFFATKLHLGPRALIARMFARSVAEDGSALEWLNYCVFVANADGRSLRSEIWDERGWDAALARFDQLSAASPTEPRTLEIDNAAMRLVRHGIRLVEEGRLDELGAQYHPDLVPEGRRRLVAVPTGTSQEAWAEYMQIWLEQFSSFVVEPVAIRGDRIAAYRTRSTNEAGDEVVLLTACEIDESDRVVRQVMFDEEDEVAAVALLDEWYLAGEGAELSELVAAPADPRSPEIVNASSRAVDRLWTAAVGQRYDEVAAMLAPDLVRTDHRSGGIAAAPVTGGEAYLELVRASSRPDEVQHVEVVPLAVRGERLSLCRCRVEVLDFEIPVLMVTELDDTGRVVAVALFDEDDLAAAVDDLDDRFLAGEGASDVRVLSAGRSAWVAMRDGDLDALGRLVSPDLVTVDHQRIGFGTGDRDAFLGVNRSDQEVMRRGREYVRKGFVSGEVVLVVYESQRSDSHGNEVLYQSYFLARVDRSDRIDRMEWFDIEDWDAALARFDELAAQTPEPPAAGPRIADLVTRFYDDAVAMFATGGDVHAFADRWFADDVLRVDRRAGVSMPEVSGRTAYAEVFRATGEMFDTFAPEYLASRGERLGLVRMTAETEGYEIAYLIVVEFDDAGQASHFVHFDPDGLVGAMQELEDRFVAGEGAADAYVIRRIGDLVRARDRRDWEGVAGMCSPDLLAADHRLLPYALSDRDSYVAMQQGVVDLVPDVSLELRTLEVRGDAVMSLVKSRGTSADGSRATWEFWNVGRLVAGRLASIDFFDLADEATARVRFEQLASADPRVPTVDNAYVRVQERHAWLLARADDVSLVAGFDLLAPGVVQIDRRHGVAAPDLLGREARVENLAAVAATFGQMQVDHVAARGERLGLLRWRITAESGFHVIGYDVNELDGDGRLCRIVTFDDTQLPDALEELERRHQELSGDAYAQVEDTYARASLALTRGELDAWRAVQAPDLEMVDHSPAGAGRGGLEGAAAYMSEWRAQTPDFVHLRRRSFVAGDHMLSALALRGTTAEGNRYEWDYASVTRVDAAGLLAEDHLFPIEQWADARALFDKRSAETGGAAPSRSALGNLATRRFAEMMARTNAGDAEGLGSLMAPVFEAMDRRTVTFGPTTAGEEFLRSATGLVEVFDEIVQDEVLATRGERLHVTRNRFVTANGFDVPILGLGEIDDEGRILATIMFDPDDVAGAMQELDARFRAGEGAGGAYALARTDDFGRAYAARDWAAVSALFADDAVVTDHRSIGQGWSTGDDFVASSRAVIELVPDVVHVVRELEARNSVVLANSEAFGTTQDGNGYSWPYRMVVAYRGGRIAHFELFDETDEVRARARFEELAAADPRTPSIDNDAVRQMVRLEWVARFDRDRSVELLSPDVAFTDRRGVVSVPTLSGVEGMSTSYSSLFAVYDDLALEPVAVRGSRLALFRFRMSTDGGSESTGFMFVQLDTHGRIVEFVGFEDELASALEELERRHEDLSGDAYAPVERTYAQASVALARGELKAWQAFQAPGVNVVDHTPLGAGDLDGDLAQRHLTVWRDQTPDFVSYRTRSFPQGQAMLSALAIRGTTPEGNRYAWDFATVVRVDGAGRILEEHFFPIEQWEDARALYDDWSGEAVAPATAPAERRALENRATRHAERFVALLRDDPGAIPTIIRPDAAFVDHRWGGIAPAATGPHEFVDHLRAGTGAGFVRTDFEVLAVRGESLAVSRWTSVSDARDTSVHLALNEVDEDDRIVRSALFEPGDLARVVALLDEWYLEGEGAEHAWMIRPSMNFWRNYNARDWDAVRRGLADTLTVVDHRLASAGSMIQTMDQFLTYTQEMVTLVPDVTAFDAEYLAIGGLWSLSRHTALGTSTQGADVEFAAVMLTDTRDGRFTRTETFAPDQLAEAFARFAELEAAEGSSS